MTVRTRVILAIAVIASLLASAPAGAGAQERTPDELKELSNDDFMVAMYALDYDLSEKVAAQRLDRMERVRPLLEEIREIEASRLAGSGFDHTESSAGWVRLTGDEQPQRATQAILKDEPSLKVELGARNTLDELVEAVDSSETWKGVNRSGIAWSDIDQRTGEIVVALDQASVSEQLFERRSSELMQQLQLSLEGDLGRDRAGVKPLVSVIRGNATTATAEMEGGQSITANGGTHMCTSAFGVQRNGVKGFLTAGHCRESGVITEHFDTRDHATRGSSWHVDVGVNRNLLWGDYGDSTWYSLTAGDTVSDDFWVTRFSEKDVNGKQNRAGMIGDFICHNGASSFRSCGTVQGITFDPNWSICDGGPIANGCSHRWVRATGNNLNSCVGDSGGPVFKNRKAYGVMSGVLSSDEAACGGVQSVAFLFTAIDDIENRLNVTLLTS